MGRNEYNVFTELNDLNTADFSLDSMIDNMSKFDMKDLQFMKDCTDFMIIYNKHKKEIA